MIADTTSRSSDVFPGRIMDPVPGVRTVGELELIEMLGYPTEAVGN